MIQQLEPIGRECGNLSQRLTGLEARARLLSQDLSGGEGGVGGSAPIQAKSPGISSGSFGERSVMSPQPVFPKKIPIQGEKNTCFKGGNL